MAPQGRTLSVGAHVERAARLHGTRVAVRDPERTLTYGQLAGECRRLANALAGLGVTKGDRVALLLPDSARWIAADLALALLGAITVALDPRATDVELRERLDLVEPRLAIVAEADAERLHAIAPELARIGAGDEYDELVRRGGAAAPAVAIDPERDGRIIRLSSGTTGAPKGILLTHRNWLTGSYNLLLDRCAVAPGDVFLGTSPFMYASGGWLLALMMRGAATVIPARRAAEDVLAEAARSGVTILQLVPTMLARLLAACGPDAAELRSVHTFNYGSGPVRPGLLDEAIERLGLRLVQGYGLSEAPNVVALGAREHAGLRFGADWEQPLGREGTLVDAAIVDDDGAPVPAGEPGELALRGDMIMAGYWRDPEATATVMRGEWFLSGDIVRRTEDGLLHLVDRKKEVIVTGGLNVYPQEVEAVLRRHPAVRDVAVIGLPDPEWGERITAFVVAGDEPPSEAELVAAVGERLSGHKKPKEILFVPDLPTGANGKIARAALRARYGGSG